MQARALCGPSLAGLRQGTARVASCELVTACELCTWGWGPGRAFLDGSGEPPSQGPYLLPFSHIST